VVGYILLCAILLFVSWNVVHIWKTKTTYINYRDCTYNLTSLKMCTSQHGHDGEKKHPSIVTDWKQFSPLDD